MKLAKQTVLGAAKLAVESADSPEILRKNVTSKGGTTEAALKRIRTGEARRAIHPRGRGGEQARRGDWAANGGQGLE